MWKLKTLSGCECWRRSLSAHKKWVSYAAYSSKHVRTVSVKFTLENPGAFALYELFVSAVCICECECVRVCVSVFRARSDESSLPNTRRGHEGAIKPEWNQTFLKGKPRAHSLSYKHTHQGSLWGFQPFLVFCLYICVVYFCKFVMSLMFYDSETKLNHPNHISSLW